MYVYIKTHEPSTTHKDFHHLNISFKESQKMYLKKY